MFAGPRAPRFQIEGGRCPWRLEARQWAMEGGVVGQRWNEVQQDEHRVFFSHFMAVRWMTEEKGRKLHTTLLSFFLKNCSAIRTVLQSQKGLRGPSPSSLSYTCGEYMCIYTDKHTCASICITYTLLDKSWCRTGGVCPKPCCIWLWDDSIPTS